LFICRTYSLRKRETAAFVNRSRRLIFFRATERLGLGGRKIFNVFERRFFRSFADFFILKSLARRRRFIVENIYAVISAIQRPSGLPVKFTWFCLPSVL
jgi:hypothetical protein